MDSYNRRGCDEIMCQFMKDLDSPYDIDIDIDLEDELEHNNDFSVNV